MPLNGRGKTTAFTAATLKLICLFLFTAFWLPAFADGPQNNLLPNARLFLTTATPSGSDALGILGEAGPRNFRGNLTYGRAITPCQRIKLSGEFLAQRLKYDFLSGVGHRWIPQAGVGGAYQYVIDHSFFQSLDADVAYSHAFSRDLPEKTVFIGGRAFSLKRRVAGSDGIFSYLGLSLGLWRCGYLFLGANYDRVLYHRVLENKTHAQGFGGSAEFKQQFAKEVHLSLEAQLRQPFFFYQALLNWTRRFSCWEIDCGLYGNYTKGRHHLPNVAAAGIQIGFKFGGRNFDCCCEREPVRCRGELYCDLSNWIVRPAIYSPVVLAISDQKTAPMSQAVCTSVTTSTPIPNMVFIDGGPYSVDVSGFFHSDLPLTFSQTGLPPGSSIDPVTGVISGTKLADNTNHTITVTATSECGSASETFNILYANIE